MTFRNAEERAPYQSNLDPLMQWWTKVSGGIPEARDAAANSCAESLDGTAGNEPAADKAAHAAGGGH